MTHVIPMQPTPAGRRGLATDVIARLVRGTSDRFLPGCQVSDARATLAVEVPSLARGIVLANECARALIEAGLDSIVTTTRGSRESARRTLYISFDCGPDGAERPAISDGELEQLACEDTPRAVVAQVALGLYMLNGLPPSARARQLARDYCASLVAAEVSP